MTATVAAPASPYRGLLPFGDSALDAVLFFGREREREVIVANLMASRLTLLYGPSGVGKSSLLNAGVAHHVRRLAEENVARGERPQLGVVVFSSWSDEPVAAIIRAAGDEVERLTGERPGVGEDWALADALDACAAALGGELYVILDQAEEYFVYLDRNGRRDRFAAEFADAVVRRDVQAHFVLSLREDELARLDAFKAAIPGLFGNYLRLDRLDRRAARDAIEGPLSERNRLAGAEGAVSIEPALVEAVLEQVSVGRLVGVAGGDGGPSADASRIEAPYLQLVMQRIWEAEQEAGSSTLRLETLARLGGAERIVGEHLERALAELSVDEKDAAARMFTYLVTPSGSKIAHSPTDLADYAGVDASRADGVLRSLAEQRIVRPVEIPGGEGARYEIFHDVLGDTVLAWRSAYVAERRLVEERAASRRRQRQLFVIAAACLVALAVVGSVAAYAWGQRSEAREQAHAALAAERRAQDRAREARLQTKRAVEAGGREQAARRGAQRDKRAAIAARTRADKERDRAEKEAARAEKEANAAVEARADAEEQRDIAQAESREADEAREAAEAEADRAEREEREAERAEARANDFAARARRSAAQALSSARLERIGRLVQRALAQLVVDPVESTRAALRAAALGGRSRAVETAMRDALDANRVRAILRGGGGRIRDVAWSADGRFVATAADDGEARVFRVGSGRPAHVFRHPPAVNALALDPTGDLLASGGEDGVVRVYRLADGELIATPRHARRIRDVEWTHDGSRLITAGGDATVRVWTRDGLQQIWSRVSSPSVPPVGAMDVELDPLGRYVLALRTGTTARVYRLTDGALVRELTHDGGLTHAVWSPDGRWVGATGSDNARLWEVGTWATRLLAAQTLVHTSIDFSDNGEWVVTGSLEGVARVWSTRTGALVDTLRGHDAGVTDVEFRPDSGRAATARPPHVATASKDRTVRLWISANAPELMAGHRQDVSFVAFSPAGTLLLSGAEDGSARIWDAQGDPEATRVDLHNDDVALVERAGSLLASASRDGTVHVSRLGGARVDLDWSRSIRQPATALALAPRGRVVAAGSSGGSVGFWAASGRPLGRVDAGAGVIEIAYAGGDLFAVATASDVRLVAANGRVRWSHQPSAAVTSLAVDVASNRVIVGTRDGTLLAWTLAGGGPESRLAHDGAVVTVLRADGRGVLASGASDGLVRTWRTGGLAPLHAFRRHEAGVTSVRFSPDRRLLVSTATDGDVHLWHVASGRHRRGISGHVASVVDARFSPNGRFVATAGPGATGLWDARTAHRLAYVRGQTGRVNAVTWGADGRTVFVGGADGTVRRYRCSLCGTLFELRPLARAALARLQRASTPAPRPSRR